MRYVVVVYTMLSPRSLRTSTAHAIVSTFGDHPRDPFKTNVGSAMRVTPAVLLFSAIHKSSTSRRPEYADETIHVSGRRPFLRTRHIGC